MTTQTIVAQTYTVNALGLTFPSLSATCNYKPRTKVTSLDGIFANMATLPSISVEDEYESVLFRPYHSPPVEEHYERLSWAVYGTKAPKPSSMPTDARRRLRSPSSTAKNLYLGKGRILLSPKSERIRRWAMDVHKTTCHGGAATPCQNNTKIYQTPPATPVHVAGRNQDYTHAMSGTTPPSSSGICSWNDTYATDEIVESVPRSRRDSQEEPTFRRTPGAPKRRVFLELPAEDY